MVDVIVRGVPEGAEEKVKEMAMIAIERFIGARDVKVAEAVTAKFESDIDVIRVANVLDKKYAVEVLVKEPLVKEPVVEIVK